MSEVTTVFDNEHFTTVILNETTTFGRDNDHNLYAYVNQGYLGKVITRDWRDKTKDLVTVFSPFDLDSDIFFIVAKDKLTEVSPITVRSEDASKDS